MDALARVSRCAGAVATIVALALAAGASTGRFQSGAASAPLERAAQTQLVVTFRPGTPPAAEAALLARNGLTMIAPVGGPDDVVVRARPGTGGRSLAALRGSPLVAGAQPDGIVRASLTPNDTLFSTLSWPATTTNLPAAWELTLGDPSITIAVVDSGVNPVADLAGALVPGYDFVHGGTDTTDDNGHGTRVASIAAARIDNGLGVAGVCGRCSIMPIKVLDADGSGYSSTTAKGIRWAAAHGARIINLSASMPTDDPLLDEAIASAVAGGAVVVIAAGNRGSSEPAQGGYPAAASPAAIRVAGVDASGALYPWSNHGAWVDVAAPGMVAAASADGRYIIGEQGTSVAAPIVSGIAGLLLSRSPGLGPAEVKALIAANGAAVAGLDVASGRRVDALASLLAVGGRQPAAAHPAPALASVVTRAAGGSVRARETTASASPRAAQPAAVTRTAAGKRATARPRWNGAR